eukprot:SAG11_NODE_24169_length_377_cov_0.755396_1_plen_47_part_01
MFCLQEPHFPAELLAMRDALWLPWCLRLQDEPAHPAALALRGSPSAA